MPRHLFTVQETFVLVRHGIVMFPGITPLGDERFKVGDSLLLKRPDGSELVTRIAGFEIPTPNPRKEVIAVIKELGKSDIPIGTEVWSFTEK